MLSLKSLWARVRSVLQFRVKRWGYGMRGWNEADVRLIVHLEDNIWYWAALEWLFWDCGTWVCHWLHNVPLPMFLQNWERHWDEDEPDELWKLGEYWGDDLGSFWHILVCNPLCQWVWSKKSIHEPQWEMTLDEARKTFAHDPEVYQWVEKQLKEHQEYDAEKAAEELAENKE